MSIQLDTVGIIVKDMGKALAFYRTLGLAIPEGNEGEPNVEFTDSNGLTLGFLTEEMAHQADAKRQKHVGQSMNLQFKCDSPDKVNAVHAKLIAAGYEDYQEPWDAFWGQRFARIKDADGNIVNIF
ncbi:MAG: VOC family protein, partial [Pyrinomonadaceae bacterium]|nr:VOC family protein [Pyrinomonadaceae bacterium]